MITHLPSDIELGFSFRELVRRLGALPAAFVFYRFWNDLAFQTKEHGQSGLYKAETLHHLLTSLQPAGNPEELVEALLASGLCVRKDGHLFCKLFAEHNAHLDASWIPSSAAWLSEWKAVTRRLEEKAGKAAESVPSLAWYLPDGSQISKDEMRAAVGMILTLDVILSPAEGGEKLSKEPGADITRTRWNNKPRPAAKMSAGILQRAVALLREHGEAKISVILRRFLSVSRPRLNHMLPTTTEQALLNFNELLVLIEPDEGFERWVKDIDRRTANPEEYINDNRDADIKRELFQFARPPSTWQRYASNSSAKAKSKAVPDGVSPEGEGQGVGGV